MKKEQFDELVESVKEGGAILRAKAMRKMYRIEALETVGPSYRVEARLVCGHTVESWSGAHIGALRRCYECEGIKSPMKRLEDAALAGEEKKDYPRPDEDGAL
jgi:hypothetical protein